MRHHLENARHHAIDTISAVNRRLDKGVRDAGLAHRLTDMKNKAVNTLATLDDMESRQAYKGTHIGYTADIGHHTGSEHSDMDAPEARRGRSSRTGRYVHRAYSPPVDMYPEHDHSPSDHEHQMAAAYMRGYADAMSSTINPHLAYDTMPHSAAPHGALPHTALPSAGHAATSAVAPHSTHPHSSTPYVVHNHYGEADRHAARGEHADGTRGEHHATVGPASGRR